MAESIWNQDIGFNDDVKATLKDACELRYGAGSNPIVIDSSAADSNNDDASAPAAPVVLTPRDDDSRIALSLETKNWFIAHADILEKITKSKLLKFNDDGVINKIKKRFSPARVVDEAVMRAWIRIYWPVASFTAFGENNAQRRFCMCRSDERNPGDPECY